MVLGSQHQTFTIQRVGVLDISAAASRQQSFILTSGIEVKHSHVTIPVAGDKCHLAIVYKEVCSHYRDMLQIFTDGRELVGIFLKRNKPKTLAKVANEHKVLKHFDSGSV